MCPLCKGDVKAIVYRLGDKASQTIHCIPQATAQRSIETLGVAHIIRPRQDEVYRRSQRPVEFQVVGLRFRKLVYRHMLFSFHVGSNRISGYRAINTTSFQQNEHLISRAESFIRRELSVFDICSDSSLNLSPSSSTKKDPSDVESLLESIILTLRRVDLKDSSGEVEQLLTRFLAEEYSRLFIHELQSWLRSPYERLEDWDRNVQYDIPRANN